MRVIAGEARGRKLVAPPGLDVRPTTDRVREALFNALGSLDAVVGNRFVDLFAGSGALGIEALSRGAISCLFVDRDRAARAAVAENLDTLGMAPRAEVRAGDAVSIAAGLDPTAADVVLCDPPYDFDRWDELMAALAGPVGAADGLVVLETGHAPTEPNGWRWVRQKSYGSTVLTIAATAPRREEP